MTNIAKRWLLPFLDPRSLQRLVHLPSYFSEFARFRASAQPGTVRLRDTYPCLAERTATTPFDPHYFYQAAWLARRLKAVVPVHHTDVGSSVMMISVLSAQVPMTFVDIRPLETDLPDLTSLAGSITALPFANASIASLSCLHVIEHIGLGRYGDPIDANGATKGLSELARVIAPGGRLYVSTPVGHARVCFNAHRVFDPDQIISAVPGLKLTAFSLVTDQGHWIADANVVTARQQSYACGCFEFINEAS
jgi:SAM-dependent methyltransferase